MEMAGNCRSESVGWYERQEEDRHDDDGDDAGVPGALDHSLATEESSLDLAPDVTVLALAFSFGGFRHGRGVY